MQGEHRNALTVCELVGDEAAEAESAGAWDVEQGAVFDTHQFDEVIGEQHELRAGAPGMKTLPGRRKPHGTVACGQRVQIVRDEERMFEAERTVWHGGCFATVSRPACREVGQDANRTREVSRALKGGIVRRA